MSPLRADPSDRNPTDAELLQSRIAELEADAARLDWLERKGFSTRLGPRDTPNFGVNAWRDLDEKSWHWTAQYISSEFANVRDAIDAAMKAEQEGRR